MDRWKPNEKAKLARFLKSVTNLQNTYGKKIDPDSFMDGYEYLLSAKYSVDQVIKGMTMFLQRNNAMPTPADINNALDPLPEKPSDAMYVQVCKRLERNGYSHYTGRSFDQAYKDNYERVQEEKLNQAIQALPIENKGETPEITLHVAKSLSVNKKLD